MSTSGIAKVQRAICAIAALTAALAALPGAALACTCMWAGGFLTVAPNAEIIVHVRVRDYHGRNRKVDLAMDVVVLERLKGPPIARDIRIWGDNGALCRPYVSGFARGSEWILAIRPQSAEAPGRADYYIPGCGAYWLKVENGRVRGHIRTGAPGTPEQEEPLETFRQTLGAR
jgi:hypothetical protein